MANIEGIITRSDGTTLTGKLFVTLSGVITTDTSPKTVSIPTREEFDITTGVLNISLEETETDKVTYRFEIFETDGADLVEPSYMDFLAIVPNETTVQFADLIPTAIQNSQQDSGALRISKLIVSNPVFVDGIKNLSKPTIIVQNSTSQVINASSGIIEFDTEIYDDTGVWDNNRFTVPSGFGGIFVISGIIPISNNSGSERNITLAIRKNGTTVINLISQNIADTKSIDFIIPRLAIELNSTDYIELLGVTSGGFSYTVNSERKQLFINRLGI